MILALVISWLALVQAPQGPADLFVGAWENGPFQAMTEEESAGYDPCACPMLIYRLDAQTIVVDAGRGRRTYGVVAHESEYLWTLQAPVSLPDRPYAARFTSDGHLQTAFTPGLDPDWGLAGDSARCPPPADFDPEQPSSGSRVCL